MSKSSLATSCGVGSTTFPFFLSQWSTIQLDDLWHVAIAYSRLRWAVAMLHHEEFAIIDLRFEPYDFLLACAANIPASWNVTCKNWAETPMPRYWWAIQIWGAEKAMIPEVVRESIPSFGKVWPESPKSTLWCYFDKISRQAHAALTMLNFSYVLWLNQETWISSCLLPSPIPRKDFQQHS